MSRKNSSDWLNPNHFLISSKLMRFSFVIVYVNYRVCDLQLETSFCSGHKFIDKDAREAKLLVIIEHMQQVDGMTQNFV